MKSIEKITNRADNIICQFQQNMVFIITTVNFCLNKILQKQTLEKSLQDLSDIERQKEIWSLENEEFIEIKANYIVNYPDWKDYLESLVQVLAPFFVDNCQEILTESKLKNLENSDITKKLCWQLLKESRYKKFENRKNEPESQKKLFILRKIIRMIITKIREKEGEIEED